MIILNMGMPNSGYLWVSRIVNRLSVGKGQEFEIEFPEDGQLVDALEGALREGRDTILVSTEWDPRLEEVVAKHWDIITIVYTIRDPRTMIASFVQEHGISYDEAVSMTQASAENFFRTYAAVDANVVLYEHIIQRPEVVLSALSKTLEMQIIPKRAARMARTTLEAHNEAYTGTDAELRDAAAVLDENYDITGQNTEWREVFDETRQRELEQVLTPFLKKMPYKLAFE